MDVRALTSRSWYAGTHGPVPCPCGCGETVWRIEGGYSTPSRDEREAFVQAMNPRHGT